MVAGLNKMRHIVVRALVQSRIVPAHHYGDEAIGGYFKRGNLTHKCNHLSSHLLLNDFPGVDAMDISGEQHLDIKHDIIKKRINTNGDVIESKPDGIGAPKSDDDCCNSCEEVRDAYRRKGWAMTNADLIDQCKREGFFERIKEQEGEGCNVQGSLEVNRVAGNFHFAPGKTFHQSNIFFDDLMSVHKDSYNISHRINRLAFGEYFPGVVNPLDGGHWTHETSNGMYQYFIKVVPTIYTDIRGRTVNSNQVIFKEEHSSFLHFITNICAVIGGIFTVAGIIDTFVYHGQRRMKKKMEIGKFR
ncbi:hypothetical protein GOBAR_DD24678 [Gossypium barbadense]|nr:hypothetical protein GOBAR_DD24678 [Gossypium barbadense]